MCLFENITDERIFRFLFLVLVSVGVCQNSVCKAKKYTWGNAIKRIIMQKIILDTGGKSFSGLFGYNKCKSY